MRWTMVTAQFVMMWHRLANWLESKWFCIKFEAACISIKYSRDERRVRELKSTDSSLHPHGSDNPDNGNGVCIWNAVYLNHLTWLSAKADFIAFCRHGSFKDIYRLYLFIYSSQTFAMNDEYCCAYIFRKKARSTEKLAQRTVDTLPELLTSYSRDNHIDTWQQYVLSWQGLVVLISPSRWTVVPILRYIFLLTF